METTLGLDDDLDGIELIEDIEAAFKMRFLDNEIENCATVRDVYNLIVDRLQPVDAEHIGCLNVYSFNRLRSALQPLVPDLLLKPSTSIEEFGNVPARKLYTAIEDVHLRTPHRVISWWGLIALVLMVVAPITGGLFGMPWWLAITLAVPAILMFRVAPIRMPDEIETFGDLVQNVAHRNVAEFASQGAKLGEVEAWEALRSILNEHTGLPIDEITKDKRLLSVDAASI